MKNLWQVFVNSISESIEYSNPLDKGILGNGLYLVPLDIENNINKYSYLYKGDKKISKKIFRVGGYV